MLQLPFNTATRFGISIVVFLAAVVILRVGQPFFIPAIIGLLLASVLGPAASWLHRVLKIRWSLACLTVILGLILVNLGLMLIFTLAVTRMVQQVPTGDKEIMETYKTFRVKLQEFWPAPLDEELFPEEPTTVGQIAAYELLAKKVRETAPVVADYGRVWVWQWVLILFILLFLLLEARMLTRRVVEIFGPSDEIKAKTLAVLDDMAQSVRTYLVWRTIINFGLAIVIGVVYQVAGLKQAWTWAILLAILNYIPYLGPLIAGVPPLIDALFSTSVPATLVIFIIYWTVIIFEGYVVVPVLMGRSMDLNATTVMLACLFWELVWGMVGLFLAMPIMAGFKSICFHVPGWRPWANLMSTDDSEPKPAGRPDLHVPPPEANGQTTPSRDGEPIGAGGAAAGREREPQNQL